MATGTPIIQVLITDEVSAKYENMRRQLRQRDQSVRFPRTTAEIRALEGTVEKLNREFVRFVGLTGIGAFMGAGLVGGIAAAARAMTDFAQRGLQLHYTAKKIGLTAEQLRRLTDAGRVLGMSQEEARGGITRLARALENLNTQGTKAKEFQELAKGRGGEELGRRLIQIVRGPDGINRAMEFLAERTRKMDDRAQAHMKNIFGLPSVAWSEIFNLPGLHKVNDAQTEDLKSYMLQWVNLERTWYNTKVTVNQALLPAFQSVLKATSDYLRGPGKGLVEQFAAWLRTADIRAFVDSLGKGIDWFIRGIEKLWPILVSIDKFVRENLGGWTTVLAGVASVAFIAFLGNFATGLVSIGKLAPVVAAIGALALAVPTSAQAATPGGGDGTGQGGGTELPEITVEAPRRRGPRTPRLRKFRSGVGGGDGGDGGDLPINAKPTSGTLSPEQQSSLRQDREAMRDLGKAVQKTAVRVASLNDY